MKKVYAVVVALISITSVYAQIITSAQTGNWTDGNTWTGGVVPGAGNDVVIAAGHTVTYSTGAFTATILSLTVNAGATLNVSGSRVININGNLDNFGTFSINGSPKISGNYNNHTGAVFSDANVGCSMRVGGASIINDGILNMNASSVLGPTNLDPINVAQTISGSGTFNLNSISISNQNAAGVTLMVPLTVNSVQLYAGKFFIGNNDVSTAAFAGGSNSTVHIVTNGTGKVIYRGGSSSKFFPVGSITSFCPVTISGGNVSNHTFSVRATNTLSGSPGSSVVNRQWDIEDITGSSTADIKLQWNGSDESGSFNRALCAIAKYDGSDWQPVTTYGAASGTNPYTRTATAITAFGSFIVASAGAFPVTSLQSGNWNSASTWNVGAVPSANDNVIIASGHTVNYDVATSTINSLSINSTGVLQFNDNTILTAATNVANAGSLRLGNSSSLRIGGDLSNSSSIQPTTGATNTSISVGGNISNTGGSIILEQLYLSNTTLGSNSVASTLSGSNISANTWTILKSGADVSVNMSPVINSLNFNGSAGKLVMQGTNTIFITGTISGYSSSKYIQLSGTSAMKYSGSSSPKIFPIGTNSYTPLIISNGNVATHDFTAQVKNSFTFAPLNSSVVNKEWNIVSHNAGAIVDLTFQWNASDEDPSFIRAMCYVGHHDGTKWMPASTTGAASGTDPYTKTATNISDFSPFAVGSLGALPVQLLSFEAVKADNKVKLNWAAENEVDISTYEIERSTDGKNFGTIKRIAITNANGRNTYNSIDNVQQGIYYYRLRINEKNGSSTYSNVVKIDLKKKFTVTLYPNPAKHKIYVQGMSNYSTVEIFSADGRLKQKQTIVGGMNYLNIESLSAGIYTIVLSGAEDKQSLQFVKQ